MRANRASSRRSVSAVDEPAAPGPVRKLSAPPDVAPCVDVLDNRQAGRESERVEQWLDEHPDFAVDYFTRKAARSWVDAWLTAHAAAFAGPTPPPDAERDPGLAPPSPAGDRLGPGPRCDSGANTPVRKISSQEFDAVAGRPILATQSDGGLTFIAPAPGELQVARARPHPRRLSQVRALDERQLMHDLILDVCRDLDTTSLCHKILQNACLLLGADRCSLFLVERHRESGERCLVSQLFDVTAESTVDESIERAETDRIRLNFGQGIVGAVAETGQALNIPDAYQDPRFSQDVDRRTGYRTRSLLCMPIKDTAGEVLAVTQAVNKVYPLEGPFSDSDVQTFESYVAFYGVGLRNAQLFRESKLETRRNQVLLDLARLIFEEQSDLNRLINKIMMHTQSLLQCERCQVLLIDDVESGKGIFNRVHDFCASDFGEDKTFSREITDEPRFPINIGITGYVAKSCETLMIDDAYEDERFDPTVDSDGFRTKAILCTPIKNASQQVIGVCQLVNRQNGSVFTKADRILFEAFALFCGLGIHNTQMYEGAVRAMAKQQVALEVLSYHAVSPVEEAVRLKKLLIPSVRYYKLNDFSFTDFDMTDDDTLRACLRMFIELNLLKAFQIPYAVLCRWLLSVKKNYRNVTYHNWRHAFNVAQTMFAIIKHARMEGLFGEMECLALLIACLCHDLDHRGTNNQFQIKITSPLAQLYSTSVLEHHHFDQCVMILNTKGNDILGNVSAENYHRVIQLIEQAILATDLARYFSRRADFFNMVEAEATAEAACWREEANRELLRAMLMTACDVNAMTKPWAVQKKVAELIASEFFEQGDIEKRELKITPIDLLNREKKDQLPAMQVGFADTICMPIYEAMAKVSPSLKPLLDGCRENRARWQALADSQKSKKEPPEQQ